MFVPLTAASYSPGQIHWTSFIPWYSPDKMAIADLVSLAVDIAHENPLGFLAILAVFIPILFLKKWIIQVKFKTSSLCYKVRKKWGKRRMEGFFCLRRGKEWIKQFCRIRINRCNSWIVPMNIFLLQTFINVWERIEFWVLSMYWLQIRMS